MMMFIAGFLTAIIFFIAIITFVDLPSSLEKWE